VGDAGYFRDPLTAHGITDALRDAELLSRAVLAGDSNAFADYEFLRNDLSVGLFETSDYIASFEWDLPTIKERHLLMSKQMGREVKLLTHLHSQDVSVSSQATALAS